MALASGTGPPTPHSEGSDCAASCKESRLMWGGGAGPAGPVLGHDEFSHTVHLRD